VLRDIDYAARWGGEEFAILLPDTDLEQAIDAAERMRVAVENHDFSSLIGDTKLTISIGVASNQHYPDHSSLLVAADQALYQAKEQGRNRTEHK
jgi:diguanylate cyclase (GGDEF)-like protein